MFKLVGVVALVVASGTKLVDVVVEDYALYKTESACATKYVESGYERAEVETGNGTCWIKGSK